VGRWIETDGWMDINREIDGYVGRWMDGWMDG
jgi:hypothetical protein